jgi:uncharacterized membrane protein
MIFDPKFKKHFRIGWTIICILIIVSMILLYTPGVRGY